MRERERVWTNCVEEKNGRRSKSFIYQYENPPQGFVCLFAEDQAKSAQSSLKLDFTLVPRYNQIRLDCFQKQKPPVLVAVALPQQSDT